MVDGETLKLGGEEGMGRSVHRAGLIGSGGTVDKCKGRRRRRRRRRAEIWMIKGWTTEGNGD